MDKLHQIVGLLLLIMVGTMGLFSFVALNPERFTDEQPQFWCATIGPDSLDIAFYYPNRNHVGRVVFLDNCIQCHSLETKEIVVGPSLQGIAQRRTEKWIATMVQNGQKLVEAGDPVAIEQYQRYDSIPHPDFTDLPKQQMKDLLEYLKLEGNRE